MHVSALHWFVRWLGELRGEWMTILGTLVVRGTTGLKRLHDVEC